MKKIKLGVNIDHVATIRNARGETYPDPVKAALLAQKSGADSITIHLREDRRHIRDSDLINIKKRLKIPLNLEMAPTEKMLKIATRYKPDYVCIVPEKRKELTTEGGLNVKKNKKIISKIIKKLKKFKIKISLFIEPNYHDIKISKLLGANSVELHTGKYCNLFIKNKSTKKAFKKIYQSSLYANKLGLNVHAGHGLTYNSAKKISKIKYIKELNIGHFIVSESIFYGLKETIIKFKKIIEK